MAGLHTYIDGPNICLGFASSASLWLSHWKDKPRWHSVHRRVVPATAAEARATLTGEALQAALATICPGARGVRLHVITSTPAHNDFDSPVSFHTWQGEFPEGAFVQTESGLLVASPALTVLMAAQHFSLPEVAELINALYATYCIDEKGELVKRANPVLTPERLKAFLDSMPAGTRGLDRARRAMTIARPGSESPKESPVAVVVAMDVRSGGAGIRDLELNPELYVPEGARMFVSTDTVRFDGFVPRNEAKRRRCDVAYDFDSIEYHTWRGYTATGGGASVAGMRDASGRDVINHDSRRRSGAREMGVEVVTFTTDDVADEGVFYAKIDQLRRLCGMQDVVVTPELRSRRAELHKLMLSNLRFALRLEERLERAIQVSAWHKQPRRG